jgi:hypothetical protein
MSVCLNTNMLYFIDGAGIEIPVDYEIIKKWSNVIAAMEWDDKDSKEIKLLSIYNYSSLMVSEHLEKMISKLSINSVGTLREPTSKCGITRVPGNINNLEIYLLLSVYLGLQMYTDEIIFTLNRYDVNINTEIDIYVRLYDTVLRHQRQHCLNNLFIILKDRDDIYPLKHTLLLILNKIVNNLTFNEYDRYMLAVKYALTLPTITKITARRLYTKGIVTDIINNEIPLIEGTKTVIANCITTESRAVRVGVESDPNLGLFWFYCKDAFTSLSPVINLGIVEVNEKKYNVVTKINLFSVRNLQEGSCVDVQKRKHVTGAGYLAYLMDTPHSQDNSLEDVKMMDMDCHYNSAKTNMMTKEDHLFRHWLDHRGMLTDVESELLHEFATIQVDVAPYYKDLQTCIRVGKRVSTWYRKKIQYYSTPRIVDLERNRDKLRHNFFFGPEVYGGVVMILKACVVTVDGDDVVIDTDCYGYGTAGVAPNLQIPYHTYDVPTTGPTFVDIIKDLPVYEIKDYSHNTYKESIIQFDMSPYDERIYEPNTLPIMVSLYKAGLTIHFHIKRYVITESTLNNGIKGRSQLRLIDESTIVDTKLLKIKNGDGTSTQQIIAYPSLNSKIYVKKDIKL